MKFRQARLVLLGLALGVLLALVLAPQTRWLVRLQALTALRLYHPLPSGPCYTGSSAGDQRRVEAVAARHPNDYAVQYAAAVADNSHDETLANLHALAARFPDRPTLYANLLRYEMLGKVRLERPEENLLRGLPPSHKYRMGHYDAPADLASFDADAAAGERLDPGNAYFPLMRAVGLFAGFRDAEGLAAFRRASLNRPGGNTARTRSRRAGVCTRQPSMIRAPWGASASPLPCSCRSTSSSAPWPA